LLSEEKGKRIVLQRNEACGPKRKQYISIQLSFSKVIFNSRFLWLSRALLDIPAFPPTCDIYRMTQMQRCNFLIDTSTTTYFRALKRGIKRRNMWWKNQIAERRERERRRIAVWILGSAPSNSDAKKRSFFGVSNNRLNNYSAGSKFLSFWCITEREREKERGRRKMKYSCNLSDVPE